MKINSSRLWRLGSALVIWAGSAILPALADAPSVITVYPPDRPFIDPCTGDPDVAHYVASQLVHDGHPNNELVYADRAGFTDNGYELIASNAILQSNGHVQSFHLTELWFRDLDGSMFRALGMFNIDLRTGAVRHGSFSEACVGGATVL